MPDEDEFHVVMERGTPDQLLPKDFWDILLHRYFPVLGLTYFLNVLGIAMKSGDFIYYMFESRDAYFAAYFAALWISIPAVIWVMLRGTIMLAHAADTWYKVVAGIMTLTVLISLILLPELNMFDVHLRTNFVASIPVFFMMYFLFVKGGLPPKAAHPLTVTGLTFMLYGAVVSFLY